MIMRSWGELFGRGWLVRELPWVFSLCSLQHEAFSECPEGIVDAVDFGCVPDVGQPVDLLGYRCREITLPLSQLWASFRRFV
jgi:hypothetical protein